MSENKPDDAAPGPGSSPPAEMSREEKIAAAKAKAEAIKAQRAAAGQAASTAAPAAAPAAKPAAPPQRSLATSDNPGGQPIAAPQNTHVTAFGTITQSVELRAEASEDQNIRRLLGGLGVYKNPLRGVWQIDYRYYAEALTRLRAAGYSVDGRDYLGRPLDAWKPESRGWTRLA
jgi:hypothetical protein